MDGDTLGATVGGLRLTWGFEITSAPVVAQAKLAVGALITTEPVATNAEIQRPVDRPMIPWMLYDVIISDNAVGTQATHQGADAPAGKSQRKMEELQEDLVLVFQPFTSMTAVVTYQCSVVLILP